MAPELKKIIVKKACELPEKVQLEHAIFGDDLIEIRLFSNSPIVTNEGESFIPLDGRFSHRLNDLLDQSGLLKD